MTCSFGNGIVVCYSDNVGRLHVGNRYIWVDYHRMCGPSFSYDANGNKPYDPIDENDPIWDVFQVWYEKHIKNISK